MITNYEGFQTLIYSDAECSKKWHTKWMNFFQLAKKFNDTKLQELFGDTNPVIDIPKSKQDFKIRDYLLVGEFLRINHPELAKDILTYGFPIANNKLKQLSDKLKSEKKILEFSGLLAKSHGMNLRDTFNEIENIGNQGDLISPYNIHIIYLMVLLRLSDYFDMYDNRNLKIVLGLKNFISNISKFEWDKNTSITEIKDHWKDKEAIFIGVEPDNSRSFINLKNLFNSMQFELDISWAVLGEVYSKDDKLKMFAIKYRRILSTLDNEDAFEKKVNYIPKQIAFDSDSDLLKLLIAPLYGDNPSYGVRELLQNAVDACKEYQELQGSTSNYHPRIDVDAFQEADKYYFEIKDNGLGMTSDTIINYFLKAGASFRNSNTWRENFEDEAHKSKVARTGRFGVGLLASFLFGNKIEVKTKHYQSNIGYKFKTHLNDTQINIEKDNFIDIGTSIRIEMNKERFENLIKSDWDKWYLFDDINILYNKKEINSLKRKNYIKIEQNQYNSVYWFHDKTALCVCNGFKIPSANIEFFSMIDMPSGNAKNYGDFNVPTLLIEDKDGKLPLSLNREKFIRNDFVFFETLVKSMSTKLFKDLLIYKIKLNNIFDNLKYEHPILNGDRRYNNNMFGRHFIFSQYGFNLFNSFIIDKNNIEKIIFLSLEKSLSKDNIKKINLYVRQLLTTNNLYIVILEDSIQPISYGYDLLLDVISTKTICLDKDYKIQSASISMPIEKYSKVFTYKNTGVKVGLKDKLTTTSPLIKSKRGVIPSEEDSSLFSRSYFITKEKPMINLSELDDYVDEIGMVTEIHIDNKNPKKNTFEYYFYNLMEENYHKTQNCWIPYSE